MPGHRLHHLVHELSLWFLVPLGVVAGWERPYATSGYVIGVILAERYFSPDLDLAHARPHANWGKLRWIWRGYAAVMTHRGLSHHSLWGGATRVLWLALPSFTLIHLVRAAFGATTWIPSAALVSLVLGFCGGVILGNSVHIGLDHLGSWWRRRRTRARRRAAERKPV